jgi:hypothetical protein
MKKQKIITAFIFLVLGGAILCYAMNDRFSEIEKITSLDIPNGSSWIKKESEVNDFDGGKMSFYVVKIYPKALENLTKQALLKGYKHGPIVEFDKAAFEEYIKTNDSVMYRLTNVSAPDYDLCVINITSGILMVRSIDIFR